MIAALAKLVALAHLVWLLAVVNSWCNYLQPGIDHVELAAKIAFVAIADPIVDAAIDPDRTGSASYVTSDVFDESSLGLRRVGDHHRSFGLGQIFGRPDLENDDIANLVETSRQIRVSFAMCGDFRAYLSSVCTHDKHVAWLSDRRVRRARELLHLWDESTATVMR